MAVVFLYCLSCMSSRDVHQCSRQCAKQKSSFGCLQLGRLAGRIFNSSSVLNMMAESEKPEISQRIGWWWIWIFVGTFFSRISTNIIVFIRLIHSTLICCNDENNQQKNLFIFWAWTPKKEPIKISQCTVSPNIYSCVAAKSPVRNGWNPHIWTEISNAVVI